jgi:hypothetical protein
MKRADEAKLYGWKEDYEAFMDVLAQVKNTMYAEWTDETLTFHPYDALRYCEAVRSLSKCQAIPDHFILSALVGIRKSYPERYAEAEPKL